MILGYSHSAAGAFLAVSAFMIKALLGWYPAGADPDTERAYLRVYRTVAALAKLSLFWTIVAGVPRAVYHADYERLAPGGQLQTAVAVAVHVVFFMMVAGGIFFWVRLSARVKLLKFRDTAP